VPESPRRRVAIWMAVASSTTTAGAVAVNFATGWVRNPWAWVIVMTLTVLSAFVSLRITRISDSRRDPAAPYGNVSVAITGNTFNAPANVIGAGTQFIKIEGGRRDDTTSQGARGAGSAC
jgi:hypothetical protein